MRSTLKKHALEPLLLTCLIYARGGPPLLLVLFCLRYGFRVGFAIGFKIRIISVGLLSVSGLAFGPGVK